MCAMPPVWRKHFARTNLLMVLYVRQSLPGYSARLQFQFTGGYIETIMMVGLLAQCY